MADKYRLAYTDGAKADAAHLPKRIAKVVSKAIEYRLTQAPERFGKPLRHTLAGYRSLRVADYRVVYRVQGDTRTVLIVAIDHRKDIYERLQ